VSKDDAIRTVIELIAVALILVGFLNEKRIAKFEAKFLGRWKERKNEKH
jgi:hypothetical protein